MRERIRRDPSVDGGAQYRIADKRLGVIRRVGRHLSVRLAARRENYQAPVHDTWRRVKPGLAGSGSLMTMIDRGGWG